MVLVVGVLASTGHKGDDRSDPPVPSARPDVPAWQRVPPAQADPIEVPGPPEPPVPPTEVLDVTTAAPVEAVPAGPEPDPPPPVVNEPPPGPERAAPAPPDGPPPPADVESTAVHPDNFPDPFVIRSNGFYWAFSTQTGLSEIPTLRSLDLLDWEPVGDALHQVPPWAESGHNWAPSVLARGSTFVLYYTTRHRATGLQCVSRAVSVLVQGPYLDESTEPLVCQTERGGSIDPSPFVDADGRAWLLWKSEGTLLGEPTRIWVQPLSADGQQLMGTPTQLLQRELDWEFPIIEGPSMVLVDGRHHLFYSGNRWETADYAVGHAVCESVTGPCRRTSSRPILTSRPGETGPGGQELVVAPSGELVLVHHAWEPGATGYPSGGVRRLHITSLRFDGDAVTVGGPWGRRSTDGLVGDLGSRHTSQGAWAGADASRRWRARR